MEKSHILKVVGEIFSYGINSLNFRVLSFRKFHGTENNFAPGNIFFAPGYVFAPGNIFGK